MGIVLADGRRVETYVMSVPQAAAAPVIESGSWRQRQEEPRRAGACPTGVTGALLS